MRLVDGHVEDPCACEEFLQPRGGKALRIGYHYLHLAAPDGFALRSPFLVRKSSPEQDRGNSPPVEAVFLVVHQGEERVDGDRRSGSEEGGQLKANALAETCREEDELADRRVQRQAPFPPGHSGKCSYPDIAFYRFVNSRLYRLFFKPIFGQKSSSGQTESPETQAGERALHTNLPCLLSACEKAVCQRSSILRRIVVSIAAGSFLP